jgi:hypothetical protein
LVAVRLKHTWSPTRRRRMRFMWSLGEFGFAGWSSCNRLVFLSKWVSFWFWFCQLLDLALPFAETCSVPSFFRLQT